MVKEMKLGEDGGMKQTVNGGIGGGAEKKKMTPLRGLGVELLERLRLHELKQMTEVPSSLHPFPLPSSPFNPVMAFPSFDANGVLHFRPPPAVASSPAPRVMFYGIGRGFHGSSSDHAAIGSGHGGFRFENSSSIPNHVKCASDGCGICHKF
ncbi:hypothetical protein OSB04_015412 [Centaurea solstitialis]|uniref:Uncharacterized protein n=1 Tax=Centaurea solstitialis TaxID=347529 RepID=A0AA38TH83_9ASTR|nr:hypothetical protein OSB04_015412 [Centaurea solstitialis]